MTGIAAELMRADDLWLKEKCSINTLYTAWELRGFQAYPLAANHGAAKSVGSTSPPSQTATTRAPPCLFER